MESASTHASIAPAAGWPSTSSEEMTWTPPVDAAFLPRSVRELAGQPFRTTRPATIATAEVRLPGPVRIAVLEAQVAMARLDADTRGGPLPAAGLLLRAEAVASCLADGVTVDALAMSLAEIGHSPNADSDRALRTAAGLRTAARGTEVPLGELLPRLAVAVTGDGVQPPSGTTGTTGWPWRETVTWTGGPTPHMASFVPPPPEGIAAAVADLTAFAARNDLDAITTAAVCYAQLQTIQPLVDANAAVARMVAHTMTRRWSLPRSAAVPLSAGLVAENRALPAAVAAFRDGDSGPIIHLVARAVVTACRNAQVLWDDITELSTSWHGTVTARSDASVWKILSLLLRQPVISTAIARGELGVSHTNAMKALIQLEQWGIVQRIDDRRRSILWVQPEVIIAHDAFTARCRNASTTDESATSE